MNKEIRNDIFNLSEGGSNAFSLSSYWKPRTYYVSNLAAGGDDGHTSDKPITPAELAALSFTGPQKIYFNKGETFSNFSLTLDQDGMTVDSYGTGALPVLSGSSAIATGDWTSEGSGVYSIAKAGAKWMYFDDEQFEIAKTLFNNSFAMPVDALPETNKISVTAGYKTYLDGFTSLVGNKVRFIENFNFRMSYEYTVLDYTGGVLTLDREIKSVIAGNMFFLYNSSEFLANEKWCYDGTTIKIKTATTLADHTVSYGRKDIGLTVTGNNCTIQNIALKHYQRKGISCYNKTITVTNCTIRDSRGNAIYVHGNDAIPTITDNTIYNIGNNGVYIGAVASGSILRNTIYNIGNGYDTSYPVTDSYVSLPAYPALSEYGATDDVVKLSGSGIIADFEWTESYTLPESLIIRYNVIHDVGATGIKVTGDNHLIQYNKVYNFQNVWNDLAGIDFFSATTASYPDASCQHLSIKQNIVYDPVRLPKWNAVVPPTIMCGIYADLASADIDIDSNLVYTTGRPVLLDGLMTLTTPIYGIMLANTGENIRVYNNIIKDFGENLAIYGVSTNVNIHDNILYTTTGDYSLSVYYNQLPSGVINNNTYVSPLSAIKILYNGTDYTLAAWKTLSSFDLTSTSKTAYATTVSVPIADDCKLLINATNATAATACPSQYVDIDGDTVASFDLAAYSGVAVFRDYENLVINSNLIAAYSFDGHVRDYSANGFDGSIDSDGGGTAWQKAPKYKGLNLTDVASIVTVSNNSKFSFTDGSSNDKPVTFATWIKLTSLADTQYGISKTTGAAYEWFIGVVGGKLSVYFYKSDASAFIGRAITPALNQWYHLMITYDGSKAATGIKFYLNNVLQTSDNGSSGTYTGMSVTAGDVKIGASASNANSFYAFLDELKIFDKELNESEREAVLEGSYLY